MKSLWLFFLLGIASGKVISKREIPKNTTEFLVAINGYSPQQDDDYVSIAVKAKPGYIVKFEPSASADRIHHILLYGCTTPAYEKEFWPGGETCRGPAHILYAWARNAPSLELPEDVAFPIGNPGDSVQYIVMQIHYARPFVGKVRDFSGVRLHLIHEKPKYVAQVYLFVSGDPIPPGHEAAYNNMSCYYRGESVLHPFAFRTHTHGMGRAVSAFMKHEGVWTKIGKRNPQWPQLFQSVDQPLEIKNGDFLAAMCRFDSSNETKTVPMGSMGSNEMCNFYMMFYRSADEPDPFPYGALCGYNENPQLMASEYPVEGTTLLPPHPEWEHHAHQSARPFGVLDVFAIDQLGSVRFGQISGLAFDNQGKLVIFQRASRIWGPYSFDYGNQLVDKTPISEPTIVLARIKDTELIFEKAFGVGLFYMPHGIFVDESNNYYTTDVGSHQVIKWEFSGDELTKVFSLGEEFKPGSDKSHFCKPAAVAVSKTDGSIFVADGYCNNRIVRFSKSGNYISEFGNAPTASEREASTLTLGTFNLPHDISLDEDHDRIYVADRENGRVQVFNFQGTPLSEMRNQEYFGNVYSVDYCKNHGLFFVPGLSTEIANEINVFGVPLGASIFEYSFKGRKNFKRPHILRARDNSVYVGEIEDSGGVIWRFDIDQEVHDMMSMEELSMESSGPTSSQNSIVVFLIVTVSIFMGILYFMRSHRVGINSRTPTSLFDRGTFKPLRTDDGGSDDDSEDDLGISASR